MKIKLNGKDYEIADPGTVLELLTELSLADKKVAVELNLEIVPRSLYPKTMLQEGDTIEVIQAIGGG